MINWFKKKKIEKKENPAGTAFFVRADTHFEFKDDKRAFAREGYQQNIIVYKAIKKIVNSICDIDIKIMKDGEVIENHPALELFNNPNPTQGKDQFLENIFTDYLITGEMAIVKDKEVGVPVELWGLNPIDINIIPSKSGLPASYEFKKNNYKKIFPVNQLTGDSQLYFQKMYNPLNYWRGQSPLQAAALSADTHNEGLKWNHSLLSNGARPSGVLTMEGSPNNDIIGRLRELFKKNIQGASNAGEIPMLVEGVQWTETGQNAKDMDYISTMKETTKYIAAAFDVPLPLVDNDASSFNNMTQAKEMLWTDTVIPMLNKFLNGFGQWLLPAYGEDPNIVKFVADLDSVPALEGLRSRRAERMVKYKEAGIITIDEVRKDIGFEPRGGVADSLLVSSMEIPIDGLGFDMPSAAKSLEIDLKSMGYKDSEIKLIQEQIEDD